MGKLVRSSTMISREEYKIRVSHPLARYYTSTVPYPGGEERENCHKNVKYTVGKEKGEIRVSKIMFFPPTNT